MFWNNFYFLCKEHKKTPTEVVEELCIARGSVTKWKNGTLPSKKNLSKIADYFGVSVGTLFDDSDKKEKLPATNEEFMAMLREHNKGTAQVFFCGADGKVVELSPEEQAVLNSLLDLRKKKD